MTSKAVLTIEAENPNFQAVCYGQDGLVTTKQLALSQLYDVLSDSVERSDIQSGLLPPHCIGVNIGNTGRWTVFLHRPAGYADITYHDQLYQRFPLPDLVFRFRFTLGERVREAALAVVGSGELQDSSPLYCYPFSNLYPNQTLCLGNTLLPRCSLLSQLPQIMEFILSLPNNDDLYIQRNNRRNLPQERLYEFLAGKTPEIYESEILTPRGRTLGEFLKEEGI